MKDNKKIQELQLLEQSLQNFLIQKQQFQAQLMESENALQEIKNTKDKVYKILGSTIIETNKENLEKELNEKIKISNLRIKSLEKQETELKEKTEKLQQEVLKSIENANQNKWDYSFFGTNTYR